MKTEDILVSLVVPCYGVEQYLARCIESVRSQTHSNIELILVNDGSPDKSGEIADAFAAIDERVVVIHKENGGVSSARNAGIEKAKGVYVCFADGDDWLEPDYVEYLLNLALSVGADISLSDRLHVFKKGDTNSDVDTFYNESTEVLSSEDCIKRQFYYKIQTMAVFNKLYKASLLKEGPGFNSEFIMGEGFNFNIRVYRRANKVAIGHKKVYWYYKENSESATSKFSMNHIENGLRSIEDMGKIIGDLDKSVITAWKYAKYRTYCDFYSGMVRNDKKGDYPKEYNEMSVYLRVNIGDALAAPVPLREKTKAVVFGLIPGSLLTRGFHLLNADGRS